MLTFVLFLLALLILGFLFTLAVQFIKVEKVLKDVYFDTETEVKIFFETGGD